MMKLIFQLFFLEGNIELDHSLFEFTQKYTGIEFEDARSFFRRRSIQTKTENLSNVNELDDSGIEISIANNKSVNGDQSESLMVTSTPKKSEPKISPQKIERKKPSTSKNAEKKTAYMKDMHISTEVCKVISTDTIRIYYQNVNSIKSDEKMKDFISASVCEYDIVIFTETWLKNGQALKHEMSVFNEHFDVYRHNRCGSTKAGGGGVLVAVSAKLYNDTVILSEFDHLEYICVQYLNNNKSIFLYSAYIPPDSSLDIYEDHVKAIQSIKLRNDDILIVFGDFNLPFLVWETKDNKTFLPQISESVREARSQIKKFNLLKELQLKCNLHQLCNGKNLKGNVLDLVFSNDTNHISIGQLPDSQKPMSKHDERHAPPFLIIIDDCEKFPKETISKTRNTHK